MKRKMKRILSWGLILCLFTAISQVGDCTVLVVVRKGKTVWVGANSNTSNRFFKTGEDCKIHRKGNLVTLHAGALQSPVPMDGKQVNFVDLIVNAEDPQKSLEENQLLITHAMEEIFDIVGTHTAALLTQRGFPLFDHWVVPGSFQTVVLISRIPGKMPGVRGFILSAGMEKSNPHIHTDQLQVPPATSFTLIWDGKASQVRGEFWRDTTLRPFDWIKETINRKAAEDVADWGGPIQVGTVDADEGFNWLEQPLGCQQ